MRSPRPALRPDDRGTDRAQAATRRLALLAADLGVPPRPEASSESIDDPTDDTVGNSGDDGVDDVVVEGDWWADRGRPEPGSTVPQGAADTVERHAVPPPRPLPVTGRHAARRRLLPAMPDVGVAHLAVVALAIAVALAGTTWWLLRDTAEEVTASASTGAQVAPLVDATSGAASPTTESDSVTVDVAGKVRRPGIVVLDKGARVVDALEAAGGAKKGVETTTINLARVLVDGEQIVVGADVPAAPPGAGEVPGGASLVNLNLAGQDELETLPGVGPVTADAIITWREQHGGFASVDQLLDVDGIGEKTLAQIAPRATV